MKKFFGSIYVIAVLAICMIPSVGLYFFGTSQSRERSNPFPQLQEDGSFNIEFLPEAGDYFEQHFALRNLYLEADARLMECFSDTNTSTVVKGEDGWSYYASTVNDYQGADTMTERQVYNAVHNLNLMKDYVEGRGAKFLFTVPPNKNSLYGEHMPSYLQTKASDVKSYDLMAQKIEETALPYLDLFTLIGEQDEVLYLKTDSHWNNKGAFLAYRGIMDALEIPGETYAAQEIVKTKTAVGDLCKMVYPLTASNYQEYDYDYGNEGRYEYVEGADVEDTFIVTGGSGNGNLLMFRDSFGNTLLPFLSGNFKQAVYSKELNYPIEKYMDQYKPEAVVVEKVERNIREFANTPPIISGTEVDAPAAAGTLETGMQVAMEKCYLDEDYVTITGSVPEGICLTEGKIYVTVKDGEKETTYEPYYVVNGTDYGFTLYLKLASIESETLEITVLAETEQGVMTVYAGEISGGDEE